MKRKVLWIFLPKINTGRKKCNFTHGLGQKKCDKYDRIDILPEKLYDFGVGNPQDCDEFIQTKGMRERKAKMDEISDAVIALAGGFGTLEEISEMIVQKQLGYNSKPIILLNTGGFYNNLIKFFETIISQNFAKESSRELYYIAETPEDAINFIKSYKPVEYAGKF